ncbi:MAG TPA: DNA-formamidopyrimidine glycosylase family protein [Longimicrobiales bacterium]|nr:DNA-formamidopyrimidine glycosylase family protein [Longimicrobiales bacterium]
MDGRAPDDGEAGGRIKAPADDAGPFPAARRRRILFTMPELPEIVTYLHAFRSRIVGEPLEAVRLRSPSLLRTFQPPLSAVHGRRVTGLRRLGKRIVWELEGDLFLVFHLMVTGRFHRKKAGAPLPKKNVHAAFDFPGESYFLTEMAKQKKASLHLVAGEAGLAALDAGGTEPLEATAEAFRDALLRENRTLKRALTDPRILSGIGNAHSDEILHAARLSPVQRTRNLTPDEVERLRRAVVDDLTTWTRRLAEETGDAFPEKITAFHPRMGVHGRFGEPCPVCGDTVQRIVYAQRETNYCPTCQTGGKLLADRALSRLLGEDWPRTLEELEDHLAARRGPGGEP